MLTPVRKSWKSGCFRACDGAVDFPHLLVKTIWAGSPLLSCLSITIGDLSAAFSTEKCCAVLGLLRTMASRRHAAVAAVTPSSLVAPRAAHIHCHYPQLTSLSSIHRSTFPPLSHTLLRMTIRPKKFPAGPGEATENHFTLASVTADKQLPKYQKVPPAAGGTPQTPTD
jgi:hypothetical protein